MTTRSSGVAAAAPADGAAAARRLRRHRATVLAAIAPLAAIATMSYPLIALVLERAGISEFWIGVNAAGAALAMIVSSFLGPRLLRATPLSAYMGAAIFGSTATLLLFGVATDYVAWTALRIMLGFCAGAIFLAAEYWIVTVAPPERRGREIGYYALTIGGGMAVGPLILAATGVEGFLPFAVCAALAGLSGAALWTGWRLAPNVSGDTRKGGALGYFFSDPTLLWAVVLFGVVEFGAFGLLPVWILREGMTEAQSIAAVAAVAAGGLVFQPLIGLAIDRFRPRPLLLVGTLSCIALPLAIAEIGGAIGDRLGDAAWLEAAPLLASLFPAALAPAPLLAPDVWAAAIPVANGPLMLLFAILFLWGGLSGALYTVSLSTLGGRYSGASLAAANAAVVAGYGLGALIGPMSIGAAMSAAGPDGLPAVAIVLACLYLALLFARARRRRA